jgi:hypothetical protein
VDSTPSTIVLLSELEAKRLAKALQEDFTLAGDAIQRIRTNLLALEEGEGWRALGYASMRECMAQEFGGRENWLYKQLKAAKIELILSLPAGALPETHARAYGRVAKDPAAVQAVHASAVQQAAPLAPTAADVRQAAAVWHDRSVPKGSQGRKGVGAQGKFADVAANPTRKSSERACPTCGRPYDR